MTKRLARIFCLLFPLVLVLNFQAALAADLWVYTALGDSLAFGAYAPPGFGYVPVYKRHIETDTRNNVLLNPLGIPGWTSADLHNVLKNNWYFRATVRNSKVLAVNIGGNDLRIARNYYRSGSCGGADNQNCLNAAFQAFQTNWNGILIEILKLRSPGNTIIRTMDIYNPYVTEDMASDSWGGDGGLNDFEVLNPYLNDFDSYICHTSERVGIPCAPVHFAFNGLAGTDDPADKGLIAFDGLHANWRGHALIAHLLRLLGYAPLRP